MPIFKLTPIDAQSEHWRASTYKGEVIVRAENEKEASKIAESEFLIATEAVPCGETLLSPWIQAKLVSCQRLANSNYGEEGPAAVLYPKPSLR